MRIDELSFRNGKEYFIARPELLASVFAAIVNAQHAQLGFPKISIIKHLRREFCAEGWNTKTSVFEGKQRNTYFDLFKARVAIEMELSQEEYIYRSLIRFLAAYNMGKIDVGVIITNTRKGLKRTKYKSSNWGFEWACEELDWLRSTLTVPIWLIGLK